MWIYTGGGTFLAGGQNGLCSDQEYVNEELKKRIEFLSTPELRYSDFFPEQMTEEEMDAFIAECKKRTDVEVHGPSEIEIEAYDG
jgi:hypothetical protein